LISGRRLYLVVYGSVGQSSSQIVWVYGIKLSADYADFRRLF